MERIVFVEARRIIVTSQVKGSGGIQSAQYLPGSGDADQKKTGPACRDSTMGQGGQGLELSYHLELKETVFCLPSVY